MSDWNPETVERMTCDYGGLETHPDGDLVYAKDYDNLLSLYRQFTIARPISEYHEDMGCSLWWIFPLCEPPYCGTPNDCDWPDYHTHFTRLTNEMCPRPENGQICTDHAWADTGGQLMCWPPIKVYVCTRCRLTGNLRGYLSSPFSTKPYYHDFSAMEYEGKP
jgi:hypothetical protein